VEQQRPGAPPAHRRDPWRERAACLGLPLELFFGPGPQERGNARARREQAALEVCALCPVRERCLAQELSLPASAQFGIFGGMSAAQRRAALGQSPAAAARVIRTGRSPVRRPPRAA